MTSYLIHALVRKRAQLSGDIEQIQEPATPSVRTTRLIIFKSKVFRQGGRRQLILRNLTEAVNEQVTIRLGPR